MSLVDQYCVLAQYTFHIPCYNLHLLSLLHQRTQCGFLLITLAGQPVFFRFQICHRLEYAIRASRFQVTDGILILVDLLFMCRAKHTFVFGE